MASSPRLAYFQAVTAVVRDRSNQKLLTLQRSSDVRTFPLKWHFVSGGLETADHHDILKRAFAEMEEEVQLKSEDVQYVCRARPLLVLDLKNRPILVHPILFDLTNLSKKGLLLDKSVLNWENVDVRWASLGEIEGLDTVPRLLETARCLLDCHQRAMTASSVADREEEARAVDRIVQDRDHGAMELGMWASKPSRGGGKEGKSSSPHSPTNNNKEEEEEERRRDGERQAKESLLDFGYALSRSRPSMAAVGNCVTAVLKLALSTSEDTSRTCAPLGDRVVTAAQAVRKRLESSGHQLTQEAVRVVSGHIESHEGAEFKIITLSLSSTITSFFRGLRESLPAEWRSKVHVVVGESRPLLEGVRLAEILDGELGYRVSLVTDAQLGIFVKGASLVLLGADTIVGEGPDSGVVNKSGSLLLSLAAAHYHVPIMVLSSVLKAAYTTDEAEEEAEEKAVEEVTACYGDMRGGKGRNTRVRNVYFEKVPLALVTYLVTDEGVLQQGGDAQEQMAGIARDRRLDYERLFYH